MEAIYFSGYGTKFQITILKLQTISKSQIPITKLFQTIIGYLAVILSVLNFEICILVLGIFIISVIQQFYLLQAVTCLNDVGIMIKTSLCIVY